jgi:23S rRNA pseudouridine1911/1915/1917 synthase
LHDGDRIDLLEFRHPKEGPAPNPDLEVRVIREEAGLVAVEKPAGMPTHPLDYDERGTLLNGLLARYPGLAGVGEGGLLSGVVHRLDVHTSGVQLFATHYVARVHGRIASEQTLRLHLENRGDHVRVVSAGGREAITAVAPLESDSDTSLIDVRPVTGLRHQIRISLAHLGHPVVGDRLYGSSSELSRHLLHARSIRIGDFTASSPVPDEFRAPQAATRDARR